MEFRLLGPVEAIIDGSPVQLGGRQRRTVLSILLINAGQSVSTNRLIEELWGESSPEAARKTVQAHVAHLRKTLNRNDEVLTASVDGYLIRVDSDSIDTRRFEQLVEEARSLRAGDPRRSAGQLEQALGLFRGTPLAGVADDAFSLRVEAARLEELRMAAVEDLLDARLASGEASAVITEANRLVSESPLRERLWALLMLALYQSGRQGEALRAFSRLRQALAEELGIEPSPDLQALEQRILEQDPRLMEPGPVEVAPAAARAPALRNPYKGLRAFDEADEADFFGRESLVRRLRERLEERGANRLVVLAGPSGAGKSSAVRAGLIPQLRQQGREVAVMFPGNDPFDSVERAIAEATGEPPDEVLQDLHTDAPLAGTALIVVVDQFEELFTMTEPEEADQFLDLLTEAGRSVWWVVTVRADFLDRMLSHRVLGGLLEETLMLVPPLQDHEVAAAVTMPAQRVGVAVEPDLVSEIVRDVRTRPAALPLLQFALTDTFERRRGESLTLADYQNAGGISGALSRRADELYESMDQSQKDATRQLLLALVTVTGEGEEVRRRVDRETLMSLPAGEARLKGVLERLGGQRLLTFDQEPETGQPTVEVAHEALISEWPRLARWVEDSRDDLRLRQRISAAAQEWVESDRDGGFLMTGSRLDQFSGWASGTDLELTALESEYLDSSLTASRAQQKKASRTRRLISGGVAATVIIATGLGVFALSERQATEEQTRIVRVADLAAAANANLEIDPELSMLLAIEAVETTRMIDGSVLNVAEEALHRAVLSHRLLGRITHNGTGIAHFSPDGRSFVTSAEDSTTAQIWSVDPFELEVVLTGHNEIVIDAVFDPVGDRVATASLDRTVRVWNSATGEPEITFAVDGAPPLIPVFSNDGSRLAATSLDRTIRVWDLDTGEVMKLEAPGGTVNTLNLEFSPDDSLLAVTRTTDEEAQETGPLIFDVTTGNLVRTLEGHLFHVTDIGFTPDGERLVTSGFDDGTVKLWDVESGQNLATYFGHLGPVQDLQISADGSTVASSGLVDVRVWDLETLQTQAVIVGHSGTVDGIDLSPDGDLLLTASDTDLTTRLWDLTPHWSHELIGLPGPAGWLGGIAYSPDGEMLAASRETGLVTLWDPSTGREINTFVGAGVVWRMNFSPEGRWLATAGGAGVKVHDIHSGEDVAALSVGVNGNDVAFSSQGMVATADSDGVRLWGSPTSEEGELISGHFGTSLAFDPDGMVLAVALEVEEFFRWAVEIWDVESKELMATLSEHGGAVHGLAFDREAELLATAGADTTAIIWDAETFEPLHRLEGHTADVFNVAFDPVRPEVATVSGDRTLKIWDVEAGVLRITLPDPEGLSDLAYSPDGRYLAAVSPGGFVTVYMLDIDELVTEARSRLTRSWTEAECLQYLQAEVCPDPDG